MNVTRTLIYILLVVVLLLTPFFTALGKGKSGSREQPQPVIEAVRAEEPIEVDGYLQEKAWQGEGYSDFIQSDPEDGAPASEKTVVRVAYDNQAIYVSARMYDSEPGKILNRLGRRDEFVDSDWFIFSVDPYYDRRSGYQFAVNPSGTMVDWTIYNDENHDHTWDGVWGCKSRIDERGWTVEIRIPFEQLRFETREHYVWGVNFRRFIKRKNERAGIVWIPKEESGYVSHFARLEGIKNIKTGRYIELMPYSIGKAAFETREEGNPFATGKDYFGSAGMDLKVGLKSNLTLDFTVNPDFGQVEVDPAVINLSAAESYYSEKRPFFIEGANIFRFGRGGSNRNFGANWGNPRFFYSRRIGRTPQGYVDTDGHVNYPEWSTILAAAKITGKIGKGWNIGFLSSLTQREFAAIDLEGKRSRQEVEPFSSYTVLRAQKEFNRGRQGLGFITTAVVRDLRAQPLKEILNRNAFSFGMDAWTFLDRDKTWVITGWFGGTRVSGSKEKILDLQNSYPHYFQRPDATHVEVDENATSMSGWAGRVTLNKQKGNFIVNAALGAISPGFDSRDMGFQWDGDVINGHIMLGYRSFKPGKIFRRWYVDALHQRNYDFGGHKIGEQRISAWAYLQFLNYWSGQVEFGVNGERWDYELTRGGPLSYIPSSKWFEFSVHSDDRNPLVISAHNFFLSGKSGDRIWGAFMGFRWKPRSNFTLAIFPEYIKEHITAQWVTAVDDEFMTGTYGTRYIFAAMDQKTISCSIRMNWIFSPTLSLQAYIQPFISVGAYTGLKELARPKSFDFNRYEDNGSTISYWQADELYLVDPDGAGPAPAFAIDNPDFNYKSLRGTVVLRWEYRPGSTLYLVWTQKRADYSHPGDFRFGRDFNNLLKAPGDDIFMIKFTYRFKI